MQNIGCLVRRVLSASVFDAGHCWWQSSNSQVIPACNTHDASFAVQIQIPAHALFTLLHCRAMTRKDKDRSLLLVIRVMHLVHKYELHWNSSANTNVVDAEEDAVVHCRTAENRMTWSILLSTAATLQN